MPRHNLTQEAISLDRAREYEVSLNTKYTLNALGMYECCRDLCYARLNKIDLARFRCALVHHLTGPLSAEKIREAVTAEVRKRSTLRDDGCYGVETHIGQVDSTCLAYFYGVLGISRYGMETIFREAWNLSERQVHNYYGSNSNARSLARISIKIRDMGEYHPVDASIMIPPSESRSHFLRTGRNGDSTIHRRMQIAHFGSTVRVHKASSFMKCASCIAMRLYCEDRTQLSKDVTVLINKHEHAQRTMRRGNFVKDAVRKFAEERLGKKNFNDLRNKLRESIKNGREEMPEDEMGIEEYVDEGGAIEEGSMEGDAGVEEETMGEDEENLPPTGPITQISAHMDQLHLAYLGSEITTSDYLKSIREDAKKLASIEITMKKFHYKCIQLERVLVYSAQEAAASCPEEVCALIIDGCGKERTKIPYYPQRMKGLAEDAALLKCPVIGIQEAVPVPDSERGAHMGESDFNLHTTDFIIALEWTTVGGADLYASVLLDFLLKKDVVPRVLVLILDNAPVNKGEPIMAWLGLILMHTDIEECHVYYPSTGHTHTTLDAHFGKAKPKDPKKVVLTPQALKRHLEGLPRTRAVLNFALYTLADQLSLLAHSYKNRLEQHHFVLFKNKAGEAMFKYSPLMRYAEHLTARVRDMFETHAYFQYMSDEERCDGIPVFRQDDGATEDTLIQLTAQCVPAQWEISDDSIMKLAAQIPPIRCKKTDARVEKEISALTSIAKPSHDYSLAQMLEAINAKVVKRIVPTNPVGEEDGRLIMADLMQNVKFQKRGHLLGDTTLKRAGETSKIRTATTQKVLKILSHNHPSIGEEFVELAKKERGFKAIVDQLKEDVAKVRRAPRTGFTGSAPASGRSSRAGSMAPPSAIPRSRLSSATPSPLVSMKRNTQAGVKRGMPSTGNNHEEEEEADDDDDAMSVTSSFSATSSTRSGRISKKPKFHEAEP